MENTDKPIALLRDVEAVVVPMGNPVTLQKGEEAIITQSLGGSYTVIVSNNMYRIEGVHADALGLESKVEKIQPKPSQEGGDITQDDVMDCVWSQMRLVYDPEIPVNIVDLGLVYDCKLELDSESNQYVASIKMTLTAPGCGMGDHLCHDVKMKILQIEGLKEADVELVWEPQWDQSMITDEARLTLGLM